MESNILSPCEQVSQPQVSQAREGSGGSSKSGLAVGLSVSLLLLALTAFLVIMNIRRSVSADLSVPTPETLSPPDSSEPTAAAGAAAATAEPPSASSDSTAGAVKGGNGPPPPAFAKSIMAIRGNSRENITENPVFGLLDDNYQGGTLIRNPNLNLVPGPAYFEVPDDHDLSDSESDTVDNPVGSKSFFACSVSLSHIHVCVRQKGSSVRSLDWDTSI